LDYIKNINKKKSEYKIILTKNKNKNKQADKAMSNAIESELPGVSHLLCRWHIEQNIKSKFPFSSKLNYQSFTNDFSELYFLKTEEGLKELVHHLFLKYNLTNSTFGDYLKKYVLVEGTIEKWAGPWIHHLKTLGIKTNQRVEMSNSALKTFLNSKSPLNETVDSVLNFASSQVIF